MKRFQDCNKLIKTWRYRWYLLIPFHYLLLRIKKQKVWEDEYDEESETINPTGKFEYANKELIWRIAKSSAQHKMKWHYTSDEVFDKIKVKYNKNKK